MSTTEKWDSKYEWKGTILLAICFGLVGLDRFIINPLFPVMMKDLNLNYQDLGNITGIVAICVGICSIWIGGLSDKVGRRKVLIVTMVGFSVVTFLNGFVGGLASLLLVRALVGALEGGFMPTAIAATGEASSEKSRGFRLGLLSAMLALVGIGLGPILATQLLTVVPSWHWVFVITAIPGLVLAYLIFKTIREPQYIHKSLDKHKPLDKHKWTEIFKYRNIYISMLAEFGAMSCLFVITAMLPSYLIDVLKLSLTQMGFVLSALGVGGFVGTLVFPSLSDRIGRKPALMLSSFFAIVSLLLFIQTDATPWALFSLLFVISGCTFGCINLLCMIVPSESVPKTLIASAAGAVVGAGEIFGGGVVPIIAGFFAQNNGLQSTLYIAMIGVTVCLIFSVFLKETAPIKVMQKQKREESQNLAS